MLLGLPGARWFGSLVVPWVALPAASSAAGLGARLVCPGICGHIVLPRETLVDLFFQVARSRCCADLRIPSFY